MFNETYNNLKYLSILSKTNNIKIKKISNNLQILKKIRRKKVSEKNLISTCFVTGNKKRTYKNTGLNRHFVRTKYIRKDFTIWTKRNWLCLEKD